SRSSRSGCDDALTRDENPFARFPLPQIASSPREDLLLDRRVFFHDRVTEGRSLEHDLDVFVRVFERHEVGPTLLLRFSESRVREELRQLSRASELERHRPVPGLIRLGELEDRRDHGIEGGRLLRGAPDRDTDPPFRPKHPMRFPRDHVRIREDLKPKKARHEIERLVRKVELLRVHCKEREAGDPPLLHSHFRRRKNMTMTTTTIPIRTSDTMNPLRSSFPGNATFMPYALAIRPSGRMIVAMTVSVFMTSFRLLLTTVRYTSMRPALTSRSVSRRSSVWIM